jgi:hypothetical protein
VDWDPLVPLVPDQEPVAVQKVALEADQVSVDAAPELTVLGLAAIFMVGARPDTVTVVDWELVPPVPVQVSAYTVVFDRGPVDQVPLVATLPLQPPEAVHWLAFPEVQLRLDASPLATVEGDEVSVTVGAADVTVTCVECEADPPGPVQVNV